MSEMKPRTGIYGNKEVYDAWLELKKSVEAFIPDHSVGLHQSGTASKARANTEELVLKAKILQSHIKAVCNGRK